MKIALIHPKMYMQAYSFFPLGLSFIASSLEKNGIAFDFYDLHKDWISNSDFVAKINENGVPDLFAITGLLTSLPNTIELIKIIRANFKDKKIVLGGKISALDPDFIFKKMDIDYLVKGEGEIAIIELIQMLKGKRDILDVQGLAFKNNNEEIIFNGQADLIEDVSKYWIDFKKFDIKKYVSKNTVQSPNIPSINLVSSRGCPFCCTFCNFSKGPYNKMRYYDLDLILESIDYLKNNHNLKHVTFNDDIFTVNKERVKKLCHALLKRNISYSCSTRLDCINEEIISILDKTGCKYLCIGIESPSKSVAKIIDKRLDLDKYQENIDLLKKTNITVNFGFMIGYIGETEETIEETRKFVLKNRLIYSCFFATAFPDTKLYDMVKNKIDDEEAYLEKLAYVDLSADCILNMTDMPLSKLYSLRDHLIADSVLNALNFYIPMKFIVRKLFVIYLIVMRNTIKVPLFKKIFEFINIVIVKPMVNRGKKHG